MNQIVATRKGKRSQGIFSVGHWVFAAVAGGGLAGLVRLWSRLEVVVPATVFTILMFIFGRAVRETQSFPELRWDGEGLTYKENDEPITMRWSDLEGFRMTWEYPARIKVLCKTGSAFVINLPAFAEDQHDVILSLLGRHLAKPLPH